MRVSHKYKIRETKEQIMWRVVAKNRHLKLEAEIACDKKDIIYANYENPNGEKRYTKLFNGGTGKGTIKVFKRKRLQYILEREFVCENCGCEFGEYQ